LRPSASAADEVSTACPSNVIVHTLNGSTQVNASGPAPSTVGSPSRPVTGQLGASSRSRYTRPSGKATLT
jgi:hypothetical protein